MCEPLFRDSSNRLMSFVELPPRATRVRLPPAFGPLKWQGQVVFATHRGVLEGLSNGSWQVHASDTQEHQSVVGASRRRAAPGGQSVDLGALPSSGQVTSSSKRVGRAPWQSCPSSNIARGLPSNWAGQ